MEGLILSFLFFNIIVWLIYKHYRRGEYKISTKNLFCFTILFIAFGTYGNHLGDFWRLNEMIELFGKTSVLDIGRSMEIQYYLLAKWVDGNYVLWRLVINVVAFVGLAFFLRKSDMDNYPTLLLFATMCLFWAAGHRGWWGYIYYYFGVYLFYKTGKLWYLIFPLVSYYSHASTILLIALLPITLFKFNRYVAIGLILFLGLGIGVFQEYFDSVVSNGMDNEYYSQKIETYANQNVNNFFGSSIGEYLQNFFSMVPKYLFMFYMSKKVIFDKVYLKYMSREQNALTSVSVILFFVSIMAFFMNLGAGTFASRIMSMSTFPMLILVNYVLVGNKAKYIPKMTLWFFLSIEFTYIFSIYYAHVHGIG